MTFYDLYKNVAHAAADGNTEDIPDFLYTFIDATNRALRRVNSIRPRIARESYERKTKEKETATIPIERFGGFPMAPLINEEGALVLPQYYHIFGNDIHIHKELPIGTYTVEWLVTPQTINENDLDLYKKGKASTTIQLDDELCHLLPLLVSYYVWQNDRKQQAAEYLALYREGEALIRQTGVTHSPGGYQKTVRWA